MRIERITFEGAYMRFDVPESYSVGTGVAYCCRRPMKGARAREREKERDSQRGCRNTVASSFGSAATPSTRTRRFLYTPRLYGISNLTTLAHHPVRARVTCVFRGALRYIVSLLIPRRSTRVILVPVGSLQPEVQRENSESWESVRERERKRNREGKSQLAPGCSAGVLEGGNDSDFVVSIFVTILLTS